MCNTYYYGERCQVVVAPENRVTISSSGRITDSSLAGIILGWIFGCPALIVLVLSLWLRL